MRLWNWRHSRRLLGFLLLLSAVATAQTDTLTDEQADRLFEDSAALYRSGDAVGALAGFDRLLAHYQRTKDRNKEGDVLYAQGWVYSSRNENAKALEAFTASLQVQRELADAEGEALLLDSLGRVHVAMRRFPQALEAIEEARVINLRLGDREAEAEALHTLGVVRAAGMNELEQGLDLLEQALKIRREIGDREGEASSLSNAADINARLGRRDQALAYYRDSLELWQALADSEEVGQIQTQIARLEASGDSPRKPPTARQIAQQKKANELNNECIAHARAGTAAKAQAACEDAARLFQSAGDRAGESMALANLAAVYFALSDYTRALDSAQRALLLARQAGADDEQANALNQIGLVHMTWGQYPQALDAFERTLAIWRKAYDVGGERRTLENIAALRAILGEHEQARDIWVETLAYKFGAERADTLLNLGTMYAMSKDLVQAAGYFEQAVEIHRRADSPLLRSALTNLATVYAQSGQYDKALPLIAEALPIDRQVGDRMSEAGTIMLAGTIQTRTEQPEEALASFQQALTIAREISVPSLESSLLAQLGTLHVSQERLQEGLEAYQQSIAIEEHLRAAGQSEEMKNALGRRSSDVYQRAVLLLIRLGRNAEAFDLAERARARTFLDQLGSTRVQVQGNRAEESVTRERELRLAYLSLEHLLQRERTRPRAEQDAARITSLSTQLIRKRAEYDNEIARLKAANPEYASLVSVAPLALAEVQSLVDADTTLVSYFVTDVETVAFVVTRDEFSVVKLAVTQEELEAAVSELRGFANLGGPPAPSLARLSGWLIAPLREKLRTPFVGIVPHGSMHLLPFAALSADAGYLADAHTLFYLPSASTLPFIQAKRKPLTGAALIMAQGRAEGLPRLQHAEAEAEAVAAIYETRPLSAGFATESALREAVSGASVLHIAAHGQLNAVMPLFSRLILTPDDAFDTARDGKLEVREVYALDLAKTSLVVLSACQTQLGAQSAGDDVVGLSRAFIYAGSPSVVASLWSVDDVATSALMTSFHRHLQAGLGKALALREAQRETRAKFPDPYYWAAFVLNGDPK